MTYVVVSHLQCGCTWEARGVSEQGCDAITSRRGDLVDCATHGDTHISWVTSRGE